MAVPTQGGNTGTWGGDLNAHLAVSLDSTTGKVKNEALQVADTAPVADAALANKKYVDDTAMQAWVVFDGDVAVGSITPAASKNVASVSKTAEGLYTITWSSAFSTANYAVSATSDQNASICSTVAVAAGSLQIRTTNTGGTNTDSPNVSIMAIG